MIIRGTVCEFGKRLIACFVGVLGLSSVGAEVSLLGAVATEQAESVQRAGNDWWSLQALRRPAIPSNFSGDHGANPIDAFVDRRRTEAGLKPSAPASRRAWIRRLYFDLLGMPPEPNAVDRFVADPSPRAHEAWVERVLAAPQYGERWARHWLDVARFGESQGFERDHIRLHAWRYRDWVVNALNQNLPYDEFARMQLAGDVLRPESVEGIVATGFLVAGAYDEVGQSQQSAAMRAVVRQDEMEDYVSTVGQAFLGLTVHCARCHDHKFDPILQREYYQLSAALAGVRPGDRSVLIETEVNPFDSRIQRRERLLREQAAAVTTRIVSARKANPFVASPIDPVIEIESREAAEGAGKSEGDGFTILGKQALADKTLHLILRPASSLPGRTVGIRFETPEGTPKETLGWDSSGKLWLQYERERRHDIVSLFEGVDGDSDLHVTLVFRPDGMVWAFVNGQPIGNPVKWRPLVRYDPGEFQLHISGLERGERLQVFDVPLSPLDIASMLGVASEYVTEAEIVDGLDVSAKTLREEWQFERDQLRSQREQWHAGKAYAVSPKKAAVVHVLKRGNPSLPGDRVRAGGITSLQGVGADFGLDENAPEAKRRVALARWITDASNPLFARVIVNRLWFYHFGSGLVATPSDFGFSGGHPSHPDLLDWLAVELIERDWDLKAIHRLILTSATYRQSSLLRPEAFARDAENRFLWRVSPRRIEAEILRDAMLSASDVLNEEMGGPGFRDFSTYVHNSQFYTMLDPVGETFHRRSLYRMWIRSGRSPFLDVFDCPDPSATAPKRAVTTTPLQSLTLMNHSFVLRMSDALGERMKRIPGDEIEEEIRQAFRWCFGRDSSPDETADALGLIQSHGRSAFARALFNSSEFLYVD